MGYHLKEIIPFFISANEKIDKEFTEIAVPQYFRKGAVIFMEGDTCKYFPILKSGIVRVYKVGGSGQEITLYRIFSGESCILTVSCLLAQNDFPATAVVEEDSEVLLIPEVKLREWIKKYDIWAQYIFDYHFKVLMNVLRIIENISFKNMNERVIEYLIDYSSKNGNIIKLTHQQIAHDIGTAREVVSRTLKDLESQHKISQTRGKIIVTDLNELQRKLPLYSNS